MLRFKKFSLINLHSPTEMTWKKFTIKMMKYKKKKLPISKSLNTSKFHSHTKKKKKELNIEEKIIS
jgi:hypothetical protein